MELEELTCVWLLYRRYKARRRRQRRWWVHPVIDVRLTMGSFVTLYPKLREYPPKVFNYLRMSITSFDELLSLVKDDLSPCEYVVRDGISPEQKLVITLRYLFLLMFYVIKLLLFLNTIFHYYKWLNISS